MKLVVFGDSILKGVVTIPESKNLFDVTPNDALSWAQKKMGFDLDNRSIYGNITSKSLTKVKKFFEKGESADFCLIESGSNDCDYDWNIFEPGAELPLEHQRKDPFRLRHIQWTRAGTHLPAEKGEMETDTTDTVAR